MFGIGPKNFSTYFALFQNVAAFAYDTINVIMLEVRKYNKWILPFFVPQKMLSHFRSIIKHLSNIKSKVSTICF